MYNNFIILSNNKNRFGFFTQAATLHDIWQDYREETEKEERGILLSKYAIWLFTSLVGMF